MPNHVPLGVMQIPKTLHLPGKFLDPVLAEQALSRLISFANAVYRLRLADGHQSNIVRTSTNAPRSSGHALSDQCDVCGHGHQDENNKKTLRIDSSRRRGRLRRVNLAQPRTPSARYIIAVGGAGSFGSPAADEGIKIINAP